MRVVTIGVLLVGMLVGWSGPTTVLAAPQADAHGEANPHGEGEGGVNPLNIEGANFKGDLALWTGVVFLVVLGVLWKFAWKPIADGLTKRENRIAEEIASAERSNAEARRLLEEYQHRLEAASDEVRQMLERARQEAQKNGEKIIEEARQAAQTERDRALAEIDTATVGALKELADRSAELAVELAGKIVGTHLDRAAHTRLIEQAMADFAQSKAGRNGGAMG